jgi:hypothetical protein
VNTEIPNFHQQDWKHRDSVVTLRDHERSALEQIAGIEGKIRRLQDALVFRRAALQRIRANLARVAPAQVRTAHRED